jgi:hypothetical protein
VASGMTEGFAGMQMQDMAEWSIYRLPTRFPMGRDYAAMKSVTLDLEYELVPVDTWAIDRRPKCFVAKNGEITCKGDHLTFGLDNLVDLHRTLQKVEAIALDNSRIEEAKQGFTEDRLPSLDNPRWSRDDHKWKFEGTAIEVERILISLNNRGLDGLIVSRSETDGWCVADADNNLIQRL